MVKKPKPSKPLPQDARKVLPASPVQPPINVSFHHYETGNEYCLSHARQDDVRRCMDCLRMLTSMTWEQVRSQGGKPGSKAGLAYTQYEDHLLRVTRPARVSPDLAISSVRASDEIRIYGVRIDNVFHVLWFDLNHRIFRG